MKRLPFLLLGGLLTASTIFPIAFAQTPPTPATPETTPTPSPTTPTDPFVKGSTDPKAATNDARWANCFTVLEVYALEKHEALSVIETERTGVARYRRVTELAKTGKARLTMLSALLGKGGQRAQIESNDEVRYPVQFTPPVDSKSLPSPIDWESRNVGDTLEIEPVIGQDGHTCDVNLVPQRVSLLGLRDEAAQEGAPAIFQPIFHSQRLTTAITAYDGEPVFLGTFTPPAATPEDPKATETWLAFLRVDVQRPSAQELKAVVRPQVPGNLLQVEYSVYSVDRKAAHDLLGAPLSAGGAWEKLQPLLKEKQGRFEHLTTMFVKSGQRSATEEVSEERDWTELYPTHRPSTLERTIRTVNTGPSSDPTKAKQPKDYSKSTTTSEDTAVTRDIADAPLVPATPTLFETRNAGTTVEAEPVVGPDWVTIDLSQAVQQVSPMGKLKVTGAAEKYPAQPIFEVRKVTTSQTLLLGTHTLVSTLNPPGDDGVNGRADTGRTWLLFVRALPCER